MTTLPKWDESRTNELESFVGDEAPVSLATVAEAATKLGTSARSVAAKLRKQGYEVEKASSVAVKTFSDEQEAALSAFLKKNDGQYTFAEIADVFAGGAFTAKQIQGKVLSMELTSAVKPAEKKVYERTFTDADTAKIVKMAGDKKHLEEIADALGRTVASVRGKTLSLLRSGELSAIPPSTKVAKAADAFEGLDIAGSTVEEIADKIGRTPRGVKTMLTRRKLVAKDYDGVAKAAKAEKASAEA